MSASPAGRRNSSDAIGGRLIPVHRIYNRAIVDEIVRREIRLPFDYREPLDVEWAGHPNWYFHISKFSIPYLDHPAVPPAVFLSDWMNGLGRDRLPSDRESLILKPLFSFAGKGIQFGPAGRGPAQHPGRAARRIPSPGTRPLRAYDRDPLRPDPSRDSDSLFWPDGGDMDPVLSLVRLGRGKMMGVDHNRDQEWVGGSAAFSPPRES